MAIELTPPFQANHAILQRISLRFNPEWNGSEWHTSPTDVDVSGGGFLAAGEDSATEAFVDVPFDDLPQQAKTLIQALLVIMEQHLAEKYQPEDTA